MKRTNMLRFFLIMLAVMLPLFSLPATAQFRAGIQGTVQDTTGAVVPGASITATNQETGQVQKTVAGSTGFYRVLGLAPGKYTLTVEAKGFTKSISNDVSVNADQVRGFDIPLHAGAVSQDVTVTSDEAPVLQTENANIGTTLSSQEIKRLPQVGRDPYELLRLTPGVFGDGARSANGNSSGLPNGSGPGGSNSSIFQTENQVQVTANGQRVSANNFQIDGVSVNSLMWGGAAVVTPNQESVKQVTVLSSSYSAEDGRNSGAQVKVVSQNGTNNLHGSAIFKYNSPGLNAFNKFGEVTDPTPVRVNNRFRQYGGGVGGPIIKDKLFFFFSYEGFRNKSSDTFSEWVETPEYRQLIASTRSGGKTATVFGSPGIAPRILSTLPATCALFNNDPTRCRAVSGGLDLGSPTGSLNNYVSLGNPTGGGFDGIPDIQFARLGLPSESHGNQFNGRVDYNAGKNQFAVSTYITRLDSLSADRGARSRPMADIAFKPLNTAATATWLRTLSSTMLNEARVNFTRFADNQLTDGTTNFGIPRIQVEGMPIPTRIEFGPAWGETTPGVFAQNSIEFRDTLNKTLGAHGLKFGFEMRKEQDNNNLMGGARPLYSFVGLFNLANDTPIFEQINADPTTGGPAGAQRYFRTYTLAGFVQDDWKIRRNLTVNVGLRYEFFSPPTETQNRITNLQLGSNGLLNSKIVPVNQLFAPDKNNFAPRLGFAWSPHIYQDNIVFRGGFGVSYNRTDNVLFTNSRGNPPSFARFSICCGTSAADFSTPYAGGQILYGLGTSNSPTSYPVNPALGQGIDPATGAPVASSVEIYGSAKNIPNAYVYSYSFETQIALPSQLVGTLGYQGSSGHKLIRLVNQNFLQKPNPKFFAVYFPTPDVTSNFNALNARLSRKFTQGFQVDALYTWSKSMDELSNEGPGAQTNQTDPAHLQTEYGPSDFDVAHHFTLTGLWDLPILRDRKDWVGQAFGGWQINAVFNAHTGMPWTPKTGTQNSIAVTGADTINPTRPIAYFGGALNDVSNDAFMRLGGNFPGGGTKYFDISNPGVPGIGRNSFRGPRYRAIDLSLVKRFGLSGLHLGEQSNLEFRANMFNAFNNLNLAPLGFQSRGTFVEDPNFGRSERGLAGRVVEFQARYSF
ncbi:MAG: Cna domain protein [Acidobacteriaceae bacterium]|nr:Cna domain protein [Acidobacteriaceae bacterium]